MEEIEQVPNTYYYEKIYDDNWELKNRLATCETIAEVEAITWPEAGK